jgi:integrase
MNVVDHDNDEDNRKVWLSESEVQQLLEQPESTDRRIAFELAVRCGLRSAEILQVTPNDIVETDAGDMVKIPNGKGDKYREVPMPSTLKRVIQTKDEMREADSSEPIISVTTTQSLRHWIKKAKEQLAESTEDSRWKMLSMHDLRRTWATQIAQKDVDPLIVCQWGGWSNVDVFLEHYRGTYAPEAQERERNKVEWL